MALSSMAVSKILDALNVPLEGVFEWSTLR
jgi:hypothetical protein